MAGLGVSWNVLGDRGDALGDDVIFEENGENLGEHFGEARGELGDIIGNTCGDLFPNPTLPALGESGGVSSHSPLSWESADM